MRRETISAIAAVALIVGGFALLPSTRGAATMPTRHFPTAALPSENDLASPPGAPIGSLDILPSKVLSLYLDGDSRPDILATTDTGEVRGLVNIHGASSDGVPFVKAPFELELGGRPIDTLVTDLDGTGTHDVAFLVQNPPSLDRVTVQGSIASVRGTTVNVTTRFIDGELVGQSFRPDASKPATFTVTSNTATAVTLESGAAATLRGIQPGTVFSTEHFALSSLGTSLALAWNTGSGVLIRGDCVPPLPVRSGEEPVGLAAADADADGIVDLIVRMAPVLTGSAGDVKEVSRYLNPASPGGTTLTGTRTLVLTDLSARFPTLGAGGVLGARLVADTREGRSYPITNATSTTLTFTVDGSAGSLAQPGSPYRLILPATKSIVLRGLGGRCYAPATPIARPLYSVRLTGGTGAQATILTDPDARLRPANAFNGFTVLVGSTPLPPDAKEVTIASHTQTEITLETTSGDLTTELKGIVDSVTPSSYAIVPKAVTAPEPSAFLPNERSTLTLPADRVPFTSPGKISPTSAATLDVDGDGNVDLVVAASQLLLLMHR